MTDPVVSNVREGLPPCVSAAVFEGRRVFMRDIRKCNHGWVSYDESAGRIVVVADTFVSVTADSTDWHPGCVTPTGCGPDIVQLQTDDPAEAQAAFDKGAEWVRTGEIS